VRYNAEFRAITRRAPVRFDARDSKGSQRDAVERIDLYDKFVNRAVTELRAKLGERALDRLLWIQIRDDFPAEIEHLPDPEFAKTFFSSTTRRLFGTVGVAPEIEFVATELDPLANITSAVGSNTYLNHGSLPLLFEDVLGDVRFRRIFFSHFLQEDSPRAAQHFGCDRAGFRRQAFGDGGEHKHGNQINI